MRSKAAPPWLLFPRSWSISGAGFTLLYLLIMGDFSNLTLSPPLSLSLFSPRIVCCSHFISSPLSLSVSPSLSHSHCFVSLHFRFHFFSQVSLFRVLYRRCFLPIAVLHDGLFR